MRKSLLFCWLVAHLVITSCSKSQSNAKVMTHGNVGSTEFQAMLELSSNSLLGAPMREGARFNLDSKVVDLMVDPAASTWSWVSFDTSRQEAIASKEEILKWSQNFINQNAQNLGVNTQDLADIENTFYQPFPDTIYLTFNRQYRGTTVKNAFVQLIFTSINGSWYLREVLNNSFGKISLDEPQAAELNQEELMQRVGIEGIEIVKSNPTIVPKLTADGLYDFHYATEYLLKNPASETLYGLTVSNRDQSFLEVASNRSHVKQELAMETYKVSYVLKDQYPTPFSYAQIAAGVVADDKGIVDAPAATATITLASAKGRVINRSPTQNTTATYTFPVTFAAAGKTTVTFTQADQAALNGYMALIEVDRWVGQFLTPQQLPLLGTGITTRVNGIGNPDPNVEGFRFCNAYYIPGTLNFFQAGTEGNLSCGNTALIKDVMYHEWGHAMDDQMGILTNPTFGGKITDQAFSEGIGDINANLAGGVSGLGLGFFLNDATRYLRDATNNIQNPPTADFAEIHLAGQIISGAFWDLRQYMASVKGVDEATKFTSNLFYKHLLTTDRYVDSYQAVLRLDDNDNNPATPSPNQCLINKAFANHGLTGGATEPKDCTIADPGLKLRIDTDLGDGNIVLIASSLGANKIVFCEGKVSSCSSQSPGFAEFAVAPENKNLLLGPKLFFNTPGETAIKVKVEAGKTYTVTSINKKNVAVDPLKPAIKSDVFMPVGSKTFTFNKRDTASDLSNSFR